MMIFFSATVYKYFDIGPLNNVEFEVEMCKDVWYTNLLYYNIFVFDQGFVSSFINIEVSISI